MNLPKNESKASFEIKRKQERPESGVTYTPEFTCRTPFKAKAFVEQMLENRIDSQYKGYQGLNECKGRPAGSRVECRIVNGEEFFEVVYL